MITFAYMFTVLKGLWIFSSSAMPVRYSSFLESLTCFGVTVRSSGLKSYWVTSDISSAVRTIVERSSAPSSMKKNRKWVTRLQKSDQLIDRYRRLSAKIVPNVV